MNNSPLVLPEDRVLLSFWGEAVLVKITQQGSAFTATEVWRGARATRVRPPSIADDRIFVRNLEEVVAVVVR